MQTADPLNDVLRRAVRQLGSASAAARIPGLTPQAVSDLSRRGRKAPAEWCLKLERATGGAIARQDLPPDLYPPEFRP